MAYPLFKIWDPTNALQIINQIIQDINSLLLSGGNSVGVNGVSGVTNIAFTGAGVSVSGGAPTSTVNIPGGGGGGGTITVNGSGGVTALSFIGAGVTASGTPTSTINIPGGGGGGSPLTVGGIANVTNLTFSGAVVSGTTPNAVVTISGGGGGGTVIAPCPVGSLPAATQGFTGMITDSAVTLAAGFGNIVVGGGSNIAPTWADGTNWRLG